jgi:hypothetical protein
MTLKRRLMVLECALSPRMATLLWLHEAHAFGSLPAYLGWLVDQPRSAFPLNRVPALVAIATRAASKGRPPESVDEAVRAAVRDAMFLVHLVLEINSAAEETTCRERLRYVAVSYEMKAICLEQELTSFEPAAGGADYAERWADALARARTWLTELYVSEEARTLLERRYLDGQPSLFPDLASEWTSLLEDAEALVELVHKVDLDEPVGGRRPSRRAQPEGLDPEPLRASALERAEAAAARLVNAAGAGALDALGDRQGAIAIARRALRSQ